MTTIPHILVVDDDRQIRTSLGRFLTANGLRVTHSTDTAAMFGALEKGRFDLIVLDVMMPGEDGLSACRRSARDKQHSYRAAHGHVRRDRPDRRA